MFQWQNESKWSLNSFKPWGFNRPLGAWYWHPRPCKCGGAQISFFFLQRVSPPLGHGPHGARWSSLTFPGTSWTICCAVAVSVAPDPGAECWTSTTTRSRVARRASGGKVQEVHLKISQVTSWCVLDYVWHKKSGKSWKFNDLWWFLGWMLKQLRCFCFRSVLSQDLAEAIQELGTAPLDGQTLRAP